MSLKTKCVIRTLNFDIWKKNVPKTNKSVWLVGFRLFHRFTIFSAVIQDQFSIKGQRGTIVIILYNFFSLRDLTSIFFTSQPEIRLSKKSDPQKDEFFLLIGFDTRVLFRSELSERSKAMNTKFSVISNCSIQPFLRCNRQFHLRMYLPCW